MGMKMGMGNPSDPPMDEGTQMSSLSNPKHLNAFNP